jgi:hypothetical protein
MGAHCRAGRCSIPTAETLLPVREGAPTFGNPKAHRWLADGLRIVVRSLRDWRPLPQDFALRPAIDLDGRNFGTAAGKREYRCWAATLAVVARNRFLYIAQELPTISQEPSITWFVSTHPGCQPQTDPAVSESNKRGMKPAISCAPSVYNHSAGPSLSLMASPDDESRQCARARVRRSYTESNERDQRIISVCDLQQHTLDEEAVD